MVNSYFVPLTRLLYGIAAVLGLVGAIRVYQKFSSGDPDVGKVCAAMRIL